MSDPNEATERNQFEEPSADTEQADTDRLEGSYTEVDGEAPHERTVAGEYTRTEGAIEDESVEGDYTSTEEHPDVHDASERHGDYIRSSDAKPHPGPHKV
jgi:hypothetical protein